MAWRRGFNHQAVSDLGSLTARLVRLVALRQIRRGQAQLTAMGVKSVDVAREYTKFAREESEKFKTPQESVLLVVTTKGSVF